MGQKCFVNKFEGGNSRTFCNIPFKIDSPLKSEMYKWQSMTYIGHNIRAVKDYIDILVVASEVHHSRKITLMTLPRVLCTISSGPWLTVWREKEISLAFPKFSRYLFEIVYTITHPFCLLLCFNSDAGVLSEVFVGHSNAVWGLAYDGTKNNLVSCAADGTVRLWSPQNKSPLLNTYTADTGKVEHNKCGYEIITYCLFVLI